MPGAGISVDRMLSDCESVLGLQSRLDYDHLYGLSCLSLAVHDLKSKSKTALQTDTIVVQADDEHEWQLAAEASRVNWIKFPANWDATEVSAKRINEMLTEITADATLNAYYPLIFSLELREGSVLTLTVAPYGLVAADDVITYTYYNASFEDVTDGNIIDLPGLAWATLRYALLWHLAEKYAVDKADDYERKYLMERQQYFAQIGIHSNHVQYAESREGFYPTEF